MPAQPGAPSVDGQRPARARSCCSGRSPPRSPAGCSGINPFDQPDVESAKKAARGLLDAGTAPTRRRRRSPTAPSRCARSAATGSATPTTVARRRRRAARRSSTPSTATSRSWPTSTGSADADLAGVRAQPRRAAPGGRSPSAGGRGSCTRPASSTRAARPTGVYLQITDRARRGPRGARARVHLRRSSARPRPPATPQVLADHGRPVLRLHLTDHDAGLAQVRRARSTPLAGATHEPGRGSPRATTRCATRATSGCPASPARAALVLFGVTGDLARKKLMPAIYDLANRGLLPPGFALVGFARRDWADQDFAQVVHDAVKEHARTPFREEVWRPARRGHPVRAGRLRRRRRVRPARARRSTSSTSERGTGGNHAFYLSIPPTFFSDGVRAARALGPGRAAATARWRRVVIEKPFGHDLESAARAQRRSSTTSSRRTRSSASTTTSARRRSRTSWRCASPTSCSSRSGTPTTSTTCRSPWPRTSASAAGPATTTASAPPATSSRTTCCSCWR